jgi:hypothetical protein
MEAVGGGILQVDNLQGLADGLSAGEGSKLLLTGGDYEWSNTLDVPSGAELQLGGQWVNNGELAVDGGVVRFGGNFGTASLGVITRTGGELRITGAVDNTGQTWVMDPALGSWALDGGTITGGVLSPVDTSVFNILPNSANRLVGVTLAGPIEFTETYSRLRVGDGLTLAGGTSETEMIRMTGGWTSLAFEGTNTVSGTGTIVMDGATSGNKYLEMQANGELTLGSGIIVRGGRGLIGGSYYYGRNMALLNQGSIVADVTNETLRVETRGGYVVNEGVMEAVGGGILQVDNLQGLADGLSVGEGSKLVLTGGDYEWSNTLDVPTGAELQLGGQWLNKGVLAVDGGVVRFGGNFGTASLGVITRTGGELRITGLVDNTGQTWVMDPALGSWALDGGTITGGVLSPVDTSVFNILPNSANRLVGVTLAGPIEFTETYSRLRVGGGLTLAGATSETEMIRMTGGWTSLAFEGTNTVSGTGTIVMDGTTSGNKYLEMQAEGELTLGSGIVVRGGRGILGGSYFFGRNMNLVNQGAIIADVPGQTLRVEHRGGVFVNEGTTAEQNGGLLVIDP